MANAIVGERAAGGADHQLALLQHEHRCQVIRGHTGQPVEATAEHVVHGLLGAHQRGELLEVAREVHRTNRSGGCHG
jgi:hypothetical protein